MSPGAGRGTVGVGVLLAVLLAGGCGGRPGDRSPSSGHVFEPAPHGLAGEALRARLDETELRRLLQLAPLPPVPPDPTNRVADSPAAARLGQFLFFDAELSPDAGLSCATCHDPARAFTDGLSLAQGRVEMTRHTPGLWNTAYQRWFFWDGRADTLWAQALEPLEEPRELASDRLFIAHRIHRDPVLRNAFERVFGSLPPLEDATRFPPHGRPLPENPAHPHALAWYAMSEADQAAVTTVLVNVGKAISAYLRKLVTGPSPFDEYVQALRTGTDARPADFSEEAEHGARLFVGKAGCRFCHGGPLLSDGEFHNTFVPPLRHDLPLDGGRLRGAQRLLESPFNATSVYSDAPTGPVADQVRSLVQGPQLWGAFKTPSLRGVALTAPYMHQGQMATLEEVVRFYSTLETATGAGHHAETILVRLDLTDVEVRALVAFLEALTPIPPPDEYLAPPTGP